MRTPALSEMRPGEVWRQQQRALLRLQLRVTGEVHRLFVEFQQDALGLLGRAVGPDGALELAATLTVAPLVGQRWAAMMGQYKRLLEKGREQAATLPFGALWVLHQRYARATETLWERVQALTAGGRGAGPVQEQRLIDQAQMRSVVALWERRRQRALTEAAGRIYSDGFRLSERIWRLENGGREQIQSTIMAAMANRTNARDLAEQVEGLCGGSASCPRWTMTRLYGMTAQDRAASRRGLVSGDACQGQGLAYNALRLARNEIQIAHHAMNDEVFRHSPWVTGEKVRLSATHPVVDICDDYAEGGPYEPGEVQLPLHVQCMCYKEAVTMPADEFRNQVRGWMRGENGFLDDYAEWSGTPELLPFVGSPGMAAALGDWLLQNAGAHAEALGVGR